MILIDDDMDLSPAELDGPFAFGKEGVVASHADVEAGRVLRSALANNDAARGYCLPAVQFDAEKFRIAVSAVP